jgi:hypothetical protein
MLHHVAQSDQLPQRAQNNKKDQMAQTQVAALFAQAARLASNCLGQGRYVLLIRPLSDESDRDAESDCSTICKFNRLSKHRCEVITSWDVTFDNGNPKLGWV